MLAEIITIGDEILIGQIVDTNSAFIAKQLNKIGVSVYQITSVQDDKEHIIKSFKEAEENANIIIITGGLGPTKDDITKKTIAEYFNDTLIRNDEVTDNIKRIWGDFTNKTPPQLSLDQALVPSKAQVLMNLHGSAPGMWLEKNGKIFISLPGVPYEMRGLIEDAVIPKLIKRFKFPYIQHETLLTYGLGESALAERIEAWESHLPPYIKLAYLPSLGRVRLRLSGKSMDKHLIQIEIKHQIELLLPQIKDVFIGFERDESIEAVIGQQLMALGKTVATAESCTGGKIAESFTAIAGASQYFKGSVVSYATQSKVDVLKIDPELISEFSVVSKEVVEAMAKSVLTLFDSDYAIATTGNAGPTKGDADVEIGTVHIAIATKDKVFSERFTFGDHRHKVINRATNKAFEMLQKEISKK
ncbi:CinA family nicotinamide mononucleotide deamidase-related protein [Gelidibacter japonicus]|jgi:nicotinamide-nucleotide amidase|uniref:CinA family nicotinamide mononucleotide deamidase-related protein n=1 Tax=Gelidibacter japonicus TaxID=1962232 RepID=UPI002020FE0A|nr:CinA family nicotinamide mononucleotide deamidase-related protein [Gelidibacter japonicus]MCL8006304.1 CinA family nicotinamide mononucleotide deamidase-related protein [Gelidibacter japonicus]